MLGLITLRASAVKRSPRRWRMVGASLAFAAAFFIGSSGSTMAWSGGTFSSSDERLLFSLTNHDRASAGLRALGNDSYLHKEAEWRAKDMAQRNYFSHKIPSGGKMVFYYMQKDGYCFNIAGENIGLSTFDDSIATSSIETAFMGSPTHRANILGKWSKMGVGAYKAADGRKLYAVLFSIPCASAPKAAAKPAVTPKPVPTPTPTLMPVVTPMPISTAEPSTSEQPSAEPTEAIAVAPAAPVDSATSLRVHEQAYSQGPVDSLFHSFFGGLFGW
jgi:uncharacterized protein YkwD